MAFREKIAWLTLVAMLVVYAGYFFILGPSVGFGEQRMVDILWTFGLVAVLHAGIMAIGAGVIAIAAYREANAPGDERDKSIERRATTAGYYVLLAGMIIVAIAMPFYAPAWKIVNTALAAIVVAETARYGLMLWSYRRGWHG